LKPFYVKITAVDPGVCSKTVIDTSTDDTKSSDDNLLVKSSFLCVASQSNGVENFVKFRKMSSLTGSNSLFAWYVAKLTYK